MAKAPIRGQVKTRLARDVGDDRALEIYCRLLDRTQFVASECVQRFGWEVVWYVAGDDDMSWRESYISAAQRQQSQVLGDLGTRMNAAFSDCFANGATRAIMMGCDCPELTAERLRQVENKLHAPSIDVAIVPARDGGYVAIAMKKLHSFLFFGPEWSTANVFAKTQTIAAHHGLRMFVSDTLRDIDTGDDLQAFPELFRKATSI